MAPGTPKPTASLSSGLLARKGHARPAMRPQGFVSMQTADDLGWNDMGDEFAKAHPAPHPVPVPVPAAAPVPAPAVLQQRAALDEQFPPVADAPLPVPAPAPEPRAPVAKPPVEFTPEPALAKGIIARVVRQVTGGKAKAAFTLRLDTDRHLRLRLASAVTNRSAQQLVTEALDAFLESLTEVDTLANQLSARDGRTGS